MLELEADPTVPARRLDLEGLEALLDGGVGVELLVDGGDAVRQVGVFVEDLRSGRPFRKGLRVKGIQGASGIFEMTWADDGRATFEYGDEVVKGEAHIVWRRVGTHSVFTRP